MSDEERSQLDPLHEIDAMKGVAAALSTLSPDAVDRVLRWASDHYKVRALVDKGADRARNESGMKDSTKVPEFEDLSGLYAAINPSTEPEKVLVVGYWHQYKEGQGELDAQAINSQLKHMGHKVSNITVAFGNLMSRKPQLAIQTRKGGTSQQARKKYKLTVEGKRFVEQKLATGNGNES